MPGGTAYRFLEDPEIDIVRVGALEMLGDELLPCLLAFWGEGGGDGGYTSRAHEQG